MEPRQYSVIREGRCITWWELGTGPTTVVYCHGTPGSGLELLGLAHAHHEDITLIAPDRPGYGGTDRMPRRTVAHWVADLEEILRRRNIRNFHLLGYSGGGPHALAVVHHMPQRVRSLGLIAPAVPHHGLRALWDILSAWPRMLLSAGIALAVPDKLLAALPGNLETILVPRQRRRRYALAPGVGGAIDDERAIIDNWGFTLAEVAATVRGIPVVVWIGERDRIVHPREGAGIAADLGARLISLSERGHLAALAHPGIVDLLLEKPR